MPNQKNIAQLQHITDQLDKAKNVILADYQGLDVASQTELRQQIVEAGGEFTVQKNTLIRIALEKKLADLPTEAKDVLQGPTAVLYGYEDAVSATKVLVEFSKKNDHLKIKLGFITTEDASLSLLTPDQIQNLATLPSRDELRAKVVGQLNAPIQGFYNVLAANLRGLVQVLSAIKDNRSNR